jgi:hypothetical protein
MNPHRIEVSREGGSDVSGRALARALRQRALTVVGNGKVEIDFTGVLCASDSFLDELIGVLVAQRGTAWFRTHVAVLGLPHHIRADLLHVVQARLGSQERASAAPVSQERASAAPASA